MAIRRPIVIVGGNRQEITAPDTIDPAVLPASGVSRPFMFDAMITVLSIGAAGTVFGFTGVQLSNVIAPVITAPVTAAVALDTTADKLLELTYISGLAGNSIVVSSASIVCEQY